MERTPLVSGLAWPGGSTTAFADPVGVLGGNMSGLAYQPSGSSARGVLWAVKNNPGTLFRLVHNGTTWAPDTANGWGSGKLLDYPVGLGGNPDAEGVTLADGDPNGVYVAVERDGSGESSPKVLRFDVSSPAATLTATREWDLLADLPGLDDNGSLEAVTWIPDVFLVARGLKDESAGGADYNPASHPDHGTGLFFVGIEQNAQIRAYALNQTTGVATRVAIIASGLPGVMALDFEAETGHLWAVCDNNCNGQSKTLDIAQTGPNDGRFVPTNTFDRPAGMANLNNEGFAITPQAECAGVRKPVFWLDDSNTDGHALRSGTLNCTPLDDEPDPDPTATATPSPSPTPTPAPPAAAPTPTATPTPPARDVTAPVLSRLRASRARVAFTISEAASVRVTVERRSGRRYRRVKAFTVRVAGGARTVRFKGRVSAAQLRRGRLRVTLVATDAAGNRSKAARKAIT